MHLQSLSKEAVGKADCAVFGPVDKHIETPRRHLKGKVDLTRQMPVVLRRDGGGVDDVVAALQKHAWRRGGEMRAVPCNIHGKGCPFVGQGGALDRHVLNAWSQWHAKRHDQGVGQEQESPDSDRPNGR